MKNQHNWLRLRESIDPKSIAAAVSKTDRMALVGLVAANVVPIVLALIFSWNIGDVAMFYWWENIVAGFYALLRIIFAQGSAQFRSGKLFLVPFFTFHYFFFCFIHVIFLRLLFGEGDSFGESPFFDSASDVIDILPEAGVIGIVALLISHGVSFVKNYIMAGEYKTAHPMLEMFRPYGRIVVLHVCILAGGFAIHLLGSPMPMVILLMIGKTVLDVASHSIAHAISRAASQV